MGETEGVVEGGILRGGAAGAPVLAQVGEPAWFDWLAEARRFVLATPEGRITVRKEQAGSGRGGWYWRAYRKHAGRLHRVYLGQDGELSLARLEAVVAELLAPVASGVEAGQGEAAASQADGSEHGTPRLVGARPGAPIIRSDLVARPRLVARLRSGLAALLTLIVAPAGFGKSTLLAQSLARRESGESAIDVAWVALEQQHNTPQRLLFAVSAALEAARPGVGARALALLGAPGPPSPEAVVARLAASFTGAEAPLALVLDDFHVLRDTAIHRAVALLLERMPPTLRLVIASREEPSLPLARLRARGELVEIDLDALRLSVRETQELLALRGGIPLAPDSVAALHDRTEGWAAGLQLAALALRGQAAPSRFVADFAGTHRFIMDYLADEVLRQQAELRDFLLATSVLERLSGPLCDAVLTAVPSEEGAAEGRPESQGLLEEVERRGLFLVPLDGERRWYRYHQLFAEALRAELRRAWGVDTLRRLHRRAAEWYAAQAPAEGPPALDAAIHHALASGDADLAAGLVERAALLVLLRAERATLQRWLDALPDHVVRARPFLCLAAAGLLMSNNDLAAAQRYLDDAERALEQAESGPPDARPARDRLAVVRAEILGARGVARIISGALAEAGELLVGALAALPADRPALHWRLLINLAQAYALDGWMDAARLVLEQALRVAGADQVGRFAALSQLAWLDYGMGRLRRAEAGFRAAAALAEAAGWEGMPRLGDVEVGLGSVLAEQLEVEAAHRLLAQGLLRSAEGGLSYVSLAGELARLQLALALGQEETALEALEVAEAAAEHFAVPWMQGRLAVARADLRSNVDTERGVAGDPRKYADLAYIVAQARGTLAAGTPHDALALLEPLRVVAERRRWGHALPTILLLLARARADAREEAAARQLLRSALDLAVPERHTRPFLAEAPAILPLLRQFSGLPGCRQVRTAIQPYLTMGNDDQRSASGGAEALTPREREVLAALGAGATNAAIAQQLVVSVATVKSHLNHLFGKLGVSTRTQAAVRARELGLLE